MRLYKALWLHCCQGVCTEICLAGSLKLLTPGCVIPTAQLEFCWLNQCIKAHSVPATNGRLIRELYISNICIYREKLKYIHVYSPFCMTQTFSAVLLDLLIFNSLIWGLVLVHILNSWDQLCARGKTKLQRCSHESPGFKASLGIFTSTAIKDSCKSKSLWLPERRFSLREGNWSAPEKGGPSVRQMQGDTQRMAGGHQEVHKNTTTRFPHLTFFYMHLMLLLEQHQEMVDFLKKALTWEVLCETFRNPQLGRSRWQKKWDSFILSSARWDMRKGWSSPPASISRQHWKTTKPPEGLHWQRNGPVIPLTGLSSALLLGISSTNELQPSLGLAS